MSTKKHNDGIHIPESFLIGNAEKLKRISSEKKITGRSRVIPIWGSVAIAATVTLVLLLNLPSGNSNDITTDDWLSVDILEVYESGLVDLDDEILLEGLEHSDLEFELIEPDDDELDPVLNELSDDELYNLLNG